MKACSLGPVTQIPVGEGRSFEVDGLSVAVFHTRSGAVFATQAACPHRGGPLADGLTDGATVVCPLHDRIYNLTTGEEIGGDCHLTVYPVWVDKDGMMVMDISN